MEQQFEGHTEDLDLVDVRWAQRMCCDVPPHLVLSSLEKRPTTRNRYLADTQPLNVAEREDLLAGWQIRVDAKVAVEIRCFADSGGILKCLYWSRSWLLSPQVRLDP